MTHTPSWNSFRHQNHTLINIFSMFQMMVIFRYTDKVSRLQNKDEYKQSHESKQDNIKHQLTSLKSSNWSTRSTATTYMRSSSTSSPNLFFHNECSCWKEGGKRQWTSKSKKKFQQPIKDAHLQIAFYEFYMDQ